MQKPHHNFIISVLDTDSLTINKPDGSEFKQEEIDKLTEEINSISDELIKWDFEFYIPKLIVVKSKNYVLDYGNGKIKTKGSSIRDQKKEQALRKMMDDMIEAMVYDKHDTLVNIYHQYVSEALSITDISRWCSKKTITESITDCKDYKVKQEIAPDDWTKKINVYYNPKGIKLRKNETDVWDAVKAENPQQGDKVMLYPTILETRIVPGGISEKTGKPLKDKVEEITGLKMDKHWNNDHDVQKLVERVYKTVCIFETVLDMKNFTNFSGAKYYKMIQEGKSLSEIDVIYKEDELKKEAKKLAKLGKENET